MKKFLFLISFTLGTLTFSFAQTTPGTLFVGGSFNLSGQDLHKKTFGSDFKRTDYSFSIQGGKFIRENLVAGMSLNYAAWEQKEDYSSTGQPPFSHQRIYNDREIAVGPFIRKYVPITDKLFFFGQGTTGLTFNHSRQKYLSPDTDINESKSNTRYFFAQLSPGFTYFITDKIGLDLHTPGITYRYARSRDGEWHSHGLDLGLDLANLNYGFRFYFAR